MSGLTEKHQNPWIALINDPQRDTPTTKNKTRDDTAAKKCIQIQKNFKRTEKCSTEQKKSLTHTQDFYPKFECSETDHFKGVLAFYIDFFLKFTKIDIKW